MSAASIVVQRAEWPELADARILVVDDEPDAVWLMSRALRRAGCNDVISAESAAEALKLYEQFRPDLVVMDLSLPGSNGLNIMSRMYGSDAGHSHAPVLMITDNSSECIKRQALESGVADFLPKSADTTEFVLRARNLLHLNGLKRQIEEHHATLERTVRERTRELEEARREVLMRLALAAEYRDDATGEHTKRVGQMCGRIARELNLSENYISNIESAALLHDLGKIGVSDAILLKPGPLTPEEFDKIKLHPEIGASILEGSTEPMLEMAREIAMTHHERWDGKGYPRGLRGTEIPLCGRIVAVADVFDAITHARPYKVALPASSALDSIADAKGKQFDPTVVNAFMRLMSRAQFDDRKA